MEKDATKIVEVKEREWTDSIGSSLVGITVMAVSGLVIYFGKFWINHSYEFTAKVIASFGLMGGAAILGVAIYRAVSVEKLPNVPFVCPFCDTPNLFTSVPTKDFVCESCNRTVHFEKGLMIPVRTIICQACRTEHRVPMNVGRYVCDKCNRPLKLSTDVTQKLATASNAENEAMMHTYDVLLLGLDRRHETDLAMKLQNLMTVNMVEARKMMQTASESTPLPVTWGEPLRKAEAIRRQLEELGATVSVRPSADKPRK